jgi:hypothetical protein
VPSSIWLEFRRTSVTVHPEFNTVTSPSERATAISPDREIIVLQSFCLGRGLGVISMGYGVLIAVMEPSAQKGVAEV